MKNDFLLNFLLLQTAEKKTKTDGFSPNQSFRVALRLFVNVLRYIWLHSDDLCHIFSHNVPFKNEAISKPKFRSRRAQSILSKGSYLWLEMAEEPTIQRGIT